MAEFPTCEQFKGSLNQNYIVDLQDGNNLEIKLVEVEEKEKNSPSKDRPKDFSLIFRGPMSPVLNQFNHSLSNESLGQMNIFLVPIGPDGEGMNYQAIFS